MEFKYLTTCVDTVMSPYYVNMWSVKLCPLYLWNVETCVKDKKLCPYHYKLFNCIWF